jgi:Holliday junction resolvase RusA-like endonuclease
MAVGGVARFMRAGKMMAVPKRGNDAWATLVGRVGQDHAPASPLVGPLILRLTFYLPRPTSLPKRFAHLALPVKRPDFDNLFHKLTDKFNGVLWADDSQIVDCLIRKRYPLDGRTGVEITVAPFTNVQLQAELDHVALDAEGGQR